MDSNQGASRKKQLYAICLASIVAVYLLIFVGSFVRSTGSGMGCPDWPTCFGNWIPPTSVDQLPTDYKNTYAHHRHKKNVKFAKFLYWVGAEEKADELLNTPSMIEGQDFNVLKTWTEYLNRLLGVTVGLLIAVLFLFSIPMRKRYPSIFIYSLIILVSVIFQGWFGSIVVSTNLTPWTITIHMFLALGIVVLLFVLLNQSATTQVSYQEKMPAAVQWIMIVGIVALIVQIFLGTEVRKEVDGLMDLVWHRKDWLSHIKKSFSIHRVFSFTVIVANFILFIKLYKISQVKYLVIAIAGVTFLTVLIGTELVYLDMPALLQPVHLVLASLLLGLQVYCFLRMNTYFKFKSR